MRRVALAVIGLALIIDGLVGWQINVVAVVVGLVLVGAVSLDGVGVMLGGRRNGPREGDGPR